MSETDIHLNARIRSMEEGEVMIRTVALGLAPVIVIDIDQDDDGALKIDIDSTGPGTPEELAEFFDMAAYALKQGIDTSGNVTWDLGDREQEGITVVIDADDMRWKKLEQGWQLDKFTAEGFVDWSNLTRRHGPLCTTEHWDEVNG